MTIGRVNKKKKRERKQDTTKEYFETRKTKSKDMYQKILKTKLDQMQKYDYESPEQMDNYFKNL